MSRTDAALEIPPTAGLPLRLRDLLPPWHGRLDQALAAFLGVASVGLECSGTASLFVILKALSRRSARKSVIVSSYTCPLVAFAVKKCGLRLQICDVRPGGFEFDPDALAALCGSDTLAIVPVHLAGRVADLTPIVALARQCGAHVIEDAAQALGAKWQGQSVGLQGDAGFFSLAAGKGLSLFEGGLWLAADPELQSAFAKASRDSIPSHPGWEIRRCVELLGYAAAYSPRGLRHVYGNPLRQALRRDDILAATGDCFSEDIPLYRVSRWRQAVGNRALPRLAGFQQTLARQAAERLPRLSEIPGITVLSDPQEAEGTWPVLFVLLPSEAVRDRALRELWGAGLGVTRMFAHALPDFDYLHSWLGNWPTPNGRDFAARSLTISNSPWLDERRFARILAVLSRHCGAAA